MPSLLAGPKAIRVLMRELHPSKLDQPTHEGRFTPREIIAHLADWEPILLTRMQQTKNQPGSTIVAYDEGELAIEHKYSEKDWNTEANRYIALRTETKKWLETLTPGDWKLSATHTERGPMTLEDQANLLLGHDLYHIEQLSDLFEREVVGTW